MGTIINRIGEILSCDCCDMSLPTTMERFCSACQSDVKRNVKSRYVEYFCVRCGLIYIYDDVKDWLSSYDE